MATPTNQLANTQANISTVVFGDDDGRQAFSMANLLFNPHAMEAINNLAHMLANNSGMVPDHFNGKPGDLTAVIMQAGRWGMDPMAVAQATFTLHGKLGYEAKLIQAVAQTLGGIDFDVEYYGDWKSIQGNTKIIKVQKKNKTTKATYTANETVPNWSKDNERGVGVKIIGTLKNGKVKELDVPLNTCYPRHSTNWTFNPKAQIHYTGVKRWVNQYAPHLKMGIQDYDDLAQQTGEEKEINPNPIDITPKNEAKQLEQKEPSTLEDILDFQDQEKEIVTQAAQVESLDDILEGGDIPQVSNQDIDMETGEIYGDAIHNEPPLEVTLFSQYLDMLDSAKTLTDVQEIKSNIADSVMNGKFNEDEIEKLRASIKTTQDILKQC